MLLWRYLGCQQDSFENRFHTCREVQALAPSDRCSIGHPGLLRTWCSVCLLVCFPDVRLLVLILGESLVNSQDRTSVQED